MNDNDYKYSIERLEELNKGTKGGDWFKNRVVEEEYMKNMFDAILLRLLIIIGYGRAG